MFQSNIVARLNHLYLIQTWLELQRHCEKLYSRFKHKFVIFVSKRLLRLKRLRRSKRQQLTATTTTNNQNYESNDCYNGSQDFYCPHLAEDTQGGSNFFQDLNHFLVEQQQSATSPNTAAVSIPMQILLLPFMVQHSRNLMAATNNRCPSSNSSEPLAQQQPTSSSQFITLLPSSQHLMAANHQDHLNQLQQQHLRHKQASQIQFSSRQQANESARLIGSNTWSATVASRAPSASMKLNCGLTMRNPLINGYPAGDRRRL